MDTADQLLEVYAIMVSERMKSNTTTSTSELQTYGNQYFRKGLFLGVFPADRAPRRPPHRAFYLHNTLRSDSEDRDNQGGDSAGAG